MQAVKRAIPVGFAFEGVPMQFAHRCGQRIAAGLVRDAQVQQMLGLEGAETGFALRVKVFPYPENLCSVWAMLAVKSPQRAED